MQHITFSLDIEDVYCNIYLLSCLTPFQTPFMSTGSVIVKPLRGFQWYGVWTCWSFACTPRWWKMMGKSSSGKRSLLQLMFGPTLSEIFLVLLTDPSKRVWRRPLRTIKCFGTLTTTSSFIRTLSIQTSSWSSSPPASRGSPLRERTHRLKVSNIWTLGSTGKTQACVGPSSTYKQSLFSRSTFHIPSLQKLV